MNDRVFRAGVFRFSAAPKVHKAVQAVIVIRSAGSLCAVYSSLVEMQGQQVGDAVASAVGAERCWADVLEKLIEGLINAICDYEGRKASATKCVEIQNLSLTTRPLRTIAC
jgi:hypothetical protein